MNHFEKHFGIYVIIKLIFESLILKFEYHVEKLDDHGRKTLKKIIEDI